MLFPFSLTASVVAGNLHLFSCLRLLTFETTSRCFVLNNAMASHWLLVAVVVRVTPNLRACHFILYTLCRVPTTAHAKRKTKQNQVEHLTEMRRKLEVAESDPLLIRMGVRSGGCSGMSYVMDICQPSDVTEDVRMYIFYILHRVLSWREKMPDFCWRAFLKYTCGLRQKFLKCSVAFSRRSFVQKWGQRKMRDTHGWHFHVVHHLLLCFARLLFFSCFILLFVLIFIRLLHSLLSTLFAFDFLFICFAAVAHTRTGPRGRLAFREVAVRDRPQVAPVLVRHAA